MRQAGRAHKWRSGPAKNRDGAGGGDRAHSSTAGLAGGIAQGKAGAAAGAGSRAGGLAGRVGQDACRRHAEG